jgi:hypothetical protein
VKASVLIAHCLTVVGLVAIAYLVVVNTTDVWYDESDAGGDDPDGSALAAFQAMLVVGPLIVVAYAAGVALLRVARRRW